MSGRKRKGKIINIVATAAAVAGMSIVLGGIAFYFWSQYERTAYFGGILPQPGILLLIFLLVLVLIRLPYILGKDENKKNNP